MFQATMSNNSVSIQGGLCVLEGVPVSYFSPSLQERILAWTTTRKAGGRGGRMQINILLMLNH